MRRPPLPRLLLLAGLLAGAAAAQPPADRFPTAFFSTADADGRFDRPLAGLDLRANTELPFFGYVHNPSDNDFTREVTVKLTRDKDGRLPVARGTLPGIAARQTVRVPLTPVASPTLPLPPPKAGDPAAPLPSVNLPTRLFLHTETAGEEGAVLKATVRELPVGVARPSSYVEVVGQPSFLATDEGYDLRVTLRDRGGKERPFRGPPAVVRLDLRPTLLPGLNPQAPKSGTYQTELPPGAGAVVLAATKLDFGGTRPTGLFALSVDGFDRAFTFNLSPQGNNATQVPDSFTRLDLPRFAVPGRPLPVRVEVFAEDTAARPVLTFDRTPGGDPQVLTAARAALRDETRTLRAGETGELLLASTLRDWVIPADTTGVYGPRTFTLATDPPTKQPAGPVTVTFDATPPAVRLVGLPASKFVGTTLEVFAAVADPESGLAEVVFFLGEPPGADGKLPPGTEAVRGRLYTPPKGAKPSEPLPPGVHAASFPLPDTKGRVRLSVRATNNAGLVTQTEPVPLPVVDPPPPKPKRTVGDIKVRVTQGSTPERPQPGLPVELRTAAGLLSQSATTDDKGEATFKDLPPGGYVVTCVKLADLGARGSAAGTVVADKQTDLGIEIKR